MNLSQVFSNYTTQIKGFAPFETDSKEKTLEKI